MTFTRIALAAGALLLATSAGAQNAGAQTAPTKTYIVQLADAPAATYGGGVSGLPATRPAAGARIDINAANVRAYVSFLDRQRSAALAPVAGAPVLHKYSVVFNGVAVRLTDAQARALKASNRVKSVEVSERRTLDTTRTPEFLGLPGGLWSQFDGMARSIKGEDVIIGMVDSGVWPEDPSFGDRVDGIGKPLAYHQPGGTLAYVGLPAKWAGTCVTGQGFTAAMCNNKLIGARFYVADYDANNPTTPLSSFEYRSPRDGGGHGTHTSSTAGGNGNVNAAIDGAAVGVMSGIAPRARIATYKVCWESSVASQTGCYTADTLKAIEDAVADGVDVINFSISGTKTNYLDAVEVAFLNASAAGVFVAASAGNSGPGNQVAHMSPWLTTVAASTHDRFTVADVILGSGALFSGPSYQTGGVPSKALIRSIDAGVLPYATLTQAEKTALERCYLPADGGTANTALDPVKTAGKMVICYRGGNVLINKAAAVKAAGGTAMLLQNVPAIGGTPASNNSLVLQPYVVPTVHLLRASYTAIDAYVLSAPAAATASFGPGVQQSGVIAPVMADFSSRGPSLANLNILKPDISGPGVDIIAGWLDTSLTQAQHDALVLNSFTPQSNATSIQGTSMSSPHVAGAAALLKQQHPTWSPAAIKSALMTSTNDIKLASGALDPDRWGYGAGHLNPTPAGDPGLVYDASGADYGRFLCGLALTPPAGLGTCAALGSVAPQDLNLASLTAASVPIGGQTLTRKVTNVGAATATYSASYSMPGWSVVVSPSSLVSLAPGASATFTVKLTNVSTTPGTWTFGNLTWSDGTHSVRSPVSARALGFVAPAQVSDTRVSGSGTKVFTTTSAYTGKLSLVATGLVPATASNGSVKAGATQCFDFSVPAGAQLARFQTFNSDTLGGSATDIDLTVFDGPGGTGNKLGASEGGTSDEVVTLTAPAVGTYSACVAGFTTPLAGASFKLSSWIIGQPVGPQTLKAAGPSNVVGGGTSSIGLGWSVPSGQRYLGTVQYFDSTAGLPGTKIGSTVVFVDNH